jgi:hypothetical protein
VAAKALLPALLVAAAGWAVGIPLGLLIGVVTAPLLWKFFEDVLRPGSTYRTLAPKATGLFAFWFGGWGSSNVMTGVDWDKTAAWYLASLSLTVAVVAGVLAAVRAFGLGRRTVQP